MSAAYKLLGSREDLPAHSDKESTTSDASSATIGRSSESPTINSPPVPLAIKSRILMLTSRGVSHRHRHLLADLNSLLPHTYKDTKLDTKSSNNYNSALNALAELHSCNYIFFLEARKHGQDLYLWLAKAPNGPTVKFSVSNVHTMGELGFGGNCLKGGRGVVVFDKSFEDAEFSGGQEHKGLVREILRGVFCVPQRGVRGKKPFVDRITGVFGLDGKIWIRVYEIREVGKESEGGDRSSTDVSLVEIGPRFVLTPIVILEGSFGGPVIYDNKEFVSPNQVRSEVRLKKAGRHIRRTDDKKERVVKRGALGLDSRGRRKQNPLDNHVLFK
ncbi:hypothetical protein EPUS_09076 [Endocarpon pusillum Z07020]|uniref:Brix domain-containing protein n=1 Tax=Endocarpon pusillum (strain Z07020 / HMAS-L-300199) TaxID=1263415 RepID=U1HJZ5_ENDPU|nr:uncharacterized protein EPUS_09076 [Endocarpon pusillum Z07020]ERF69259.1 hypothetical protein EPUS_09076 [Endocarpon pusillum Z07020]